MKRQLAEWKKSSPLHNIHEMNSQDIRKTEKLKHQKPSSPNQSMAWWNGQIIVGGIQKKILYTFEKCTTFTVIREM